MLPPYRSGTFAMGPLTGNGMHVDLGGISEEGDSYRRQVSQGGGESSVPVLNPVVFLKAQDLGLLLLFLHQVRGGREGDGGWIACLESTWEVCSSTRVGGAAGGHHHRPQPAALRRHGAAGLSGRLGVHYGSIMWALSIA
jgi:hypothetical protein